MEFLIDLKIPDESFGNPDLSQVIKLDIVGSPISEIDGFKIKELQLDYIIILNSVAAVFSFYVLFNDLHNEN